MKSVLIGCPTYDGKDYCIKRFLDSLKTFPRHDVLFVDNSESEGHSDTIKSYGYEVVRTKANKEDRMQTIIDNRNVIINRAIEKGYDYVFFLDTDVLAPNDAVEKLLAYSKDIMTGVYLTGMRISGQMRLAPVIYDFAKDPRFISPVPMNKVAGEQVFEVSACGFGCCLIKKEVLEKVKLRQNKALGGGEDILFCTDAREKFCYKTFVDTSIKCTHMSKERDYDFPAAVFGFSFSADSGY